MKLVLGFLPLILISFGFLVRIFGGKKELLRMDLVQFLYAFVITPAIIIWVKTVVFFNLKNALGPMFGADDRFVIDTILTIISLYIYSFIVIHSLTKSFQIKRDKDPLFDIFGHSEYFHLWLSHIVTYSGALILMLFLGLLNLFFPLLTSAGNLGLNLALLAGIVLSLMFYSAMRIYKVEDQKKFDRVMKLQVYIYTILLFIAYLILRPKYDSAFAMFWCSTFFFVISTGLSQVLRRRGGGYKIW